ncbi:MAG: prolyl oligopeptidase family serine peptidase [Burkholderiales bacterium]|nr:prolyl oligopeptidase family serine peptidase [Burkholderiales bacterium]
MTVLNRRTVHPVKLLVWIGACLTSLLTGLDAAASSSSSTVQVQASSLVKLEDFFRRPEFSEAVLSPNGRYLATLSSINQRLNLVVVDLDTRQASVLTRYDNIDLGRLRWAGNDRILYSAVQINAPSGQDAPRSGGLFVIKRDGSEGRQLARTVSQLVKNETGGFLAMQPLRPVPGAPDEMIVSAVVANDDSFDLYRINLSTGRHRLLTAGRPADRIGSWILDSKGVPRVALAGGAGRSTQRIVYYRRDADSAWQEIARFDETRAPAFVPLAFDSDDEHLYVASNEGRANMAIYRYNPQQRAMVEMVAQHPQYDLGASPQGGALNSLLFDPQTNALAGLRIDADRPQVLWLDESMAKVQASVDATWPDRFNVLSGSRLSSRVLISSYSDTLPGRLYLYDRQTQKLEEIGASRPWLEGQLAQVRPFKLKTRDGLAIPSYVVLPRDHRPGQRLPTVVHIHGGPFARDVVQGGRYGPSFGVREAQVLASRGYAVVLPNFRITPELGSQIYYAGFGTYGQQMSDDHEDAAAWAIDQGFADPRRICISGASYGGYAALQALTRPSNPFACAIAGLPVTDLKFQRERADYAFSPAAVEYWRKVQGVADFDDPKVRQQSPLFQAERIKAPVFMYVGELDSRTPPAQAKRMADALAAAGNPVKDYFVGRGEGHGFGVQAVNVELYSRILKFLEDALAER